MAEGLIFTLVLAGFMGTLVNCCSSLQLQSGADGNWNCLFGEYCNLTILSRPVCSHSRSVKSRELGEQTPKMIAYSGLCQWVLNDCMSETLMRWVGRCTSNASLQIFIFALHSHHQPGAAGIQR